MGLKGGANGAKAQFKERFGAAFRDFESLAKAREAVGVSRSQTLAIVDGNVMLMQVPSKVDTFEGYVGVVMGQIAAAVRAAKHVVVVFDEPNALTAAKREEQSKRDSRRVGTTPVCSDDLVACPKTDAYGREELSSPALNVRLLMNHRGARPRFYDAVCVEALSRLKANLSDGEAGWTVTFDGVDPRGADRPREAAPRAPGVLSSDPQVWNRVLERADPIGEGDLKLTDVCKRVQLAADADPEGPLGEVVLNLLQTIDTDSLLIELMAQARRVARGSSSDRDQLTLLCLREAARKRKDDIPEPAYFQCIDMEMMYEQVMGYLFGTARVDRVSSTEKKLAAALFTASVALCGCDFVEVKGLSAHLMIPEVKHAIRQNPELLGQMAGVFSGHAGQTRSAASAIKSVVDSYIAALTGAPRMRQAVNKASAMDDLQVLRACWIVAYWLGYEFREVYQWGFAHAASSE